MHQPDPQATQEHWDGMAATYDAAKRRNDVYYRTLKACFDRAVPRAERGRVLEVGCGTGQILASLRPGRGLGIDLSPNMIQRARDQFANRPELEFQVMDANASGNLGEFDTVISADVLEHVRDWRSAVAAMVRLCRRGGLIAITTPSPRWALPLWVLEKVRLKMPEGPHRFVAARAIARQLEDLGCAVNERSTALMVPANLAGVGPRLSALAARLPVTRSLGVIQLIVAHKRDDAL